MKRLINTLIMFMLCNNLLNAQTLYSTRMDSIPITGDSVTLKLFEHRGTVQWQRSLDGETWRNIYGEYSDSLTIPSKIEAMYRAYIFDDNCFESFSDTSAILLDLNMNPVKRYDEISGLTLTNFNDTVCTFEVTGPYELNEGDIIIMPDSTIKKIVYDSEFDKNPILIRECSKGTLKNRIKSDKDEFNKKMKDVVNLEEIYRNLTLIYILSEEDSIYENPGFEEDLVGMEIEKLTKKNDKNNVKSINTIDISDISVLNPIYNFYKLLSFNKNDVVLEDEKASVILNNINYNFKLKFQFFLQYVPKPWKEFWKVWKLGEFKLFEVSTVQEKTGFFGSLDVTAKPYSNNNFQSKDILLRQIINPIKFVLPGNVPAQLNFDLMSRASGTLTDKISMSGNLSINYLLALRWSDSKGFEPLYDRSVDKSIDVYNYPVNKNQDFKVDVFTRLGLTICKFITPYFDYGLYLREDSKVSNTENWDLKGYYGKQPRFGVDFGILTYKKKLYEHSFSETEELLFQSPTKIDFISNSDCNWGDDYFRITDKSNRPVPNCPVIYNDKNLYHTNDEGTIGVTDLEKIDSNNIWSNLYTKATIKDRNDNIIDENNAYELDCYCDDKYVTIDSYKTLDYNGTIWTAENYNYNPAQVSDPNQGSEDAYQDGKPFYYNGSSGILYNWYAANIIAPAGWHLPNIDECKYLIDFFSYHNLSFNCSYFDIGNYRTEYGEIINGGKFWTFVEYDSENAYYFSVSSSIYINNIEIGIAPKSQGLSVRFVKD